MTKYELSQIEIQIGMMRDDAGRAKAGPWAYRYDDLRYKIITADGQTVCDWDVRGRSEEPGQAEGKFMAAARHYVPLLCDHVETLMTEVARLQTKVIATEGVPSV